MRKIFVLFTHYVNGNLHSANDSITSLVRVSEPRHDTFSYDISI